jgi:hypothetical protein
VSRILEQSHGTSVSERHCGATTNYLGSLLVRHELVVTLPREQVEADTRLYTACSAATLLCIGAGDEGLDEPGKLALFIEAHFFMLARVDHGSDIGDRDTGFSDIGGQDNLAHAKNLLLATVRGRGEIALAVASSGIAALLLEGGRTAHSMFSIPIPVEHNSVCDVEKESPKAELFRDVQLIIWDEASMQHKHAYEAVDRMLQDVRDDARPFGGITVLFAGDFRQCLPVVPKGSRGQIVASTLKRSALWEEITLLKLEENIRLMGGDMTDIERQRAADYASYILRIGDGIEQSERPDHIKLLPSMLLHSNTVEALVDHVYPGLRDSVPT